MATLQKSNRSDDRKADRRPKLPSHWQRPRQVAAVTILLVALAVTFALRQGGRADAIDLPFLIERFTFRSWAHPSQHPDPNIVLVNVDDRATDKWQEPLLGWGPHFAKALHHLRQSGARVIALDFCQPISAEEWFHGSDEAFARGLAEAESIVTIILRRPPHDGLPADWIKPAPQLFFSLPNGAKDVGYAELNRQSVVAVLTPVQEQAGEVVKSFSAAIVEHYYGSVGAGRIANNSFEIPGKLRTPLRPDGSALVNYVGPPNSPNSFRRYSIYDVAQAPDQPDPAFKDKICIIGMTYAGSNELSYVPFLDGITGERSCFGDEIQANEVHTLLSGRPLRESSPTEIWLMAAVLSLGGILAFYFLPVRLAAILTGIAAILWIAAAFGLFTYFDFVLPLAVPLIGLIVASVGMGLYRGLREEHERRHVMEQWGRYQDPRLVDYLLEHPEVRAGEGIEMHVTVLFADLKNFTKTVEQFPPTVALRALNNYLGLIAAAILDHGGIIDKYLGDGLMAQWGAPQAQPDHAAAAVQACLDINRRAAEMERTMTQDPRVTFGLRLTLHTGPVVVGVVGSAREEFTIIGDTVNVTSRLQETAKGMGCDFLVSESTYSEAGNIIRTGRVQDVEIRGRLEALKVYEVLGPADNVSSNNP